MRLTNLTEIVLQGVRLSKLPNNFGDIRSLKILEILGSNLTKIPKSIGNLVNLKKLEITESKLTDLPIELSSLTNLEYLTLIENKFEKIPECISGMINLLSLVMSNNRISEIPIFINNLTKLRFLELDYNKITILPDIFNNLTNLEELILNNNNITGYIPINIATLNSLDTLALEGNQITELSYEFNSLMTRLTPEHFTIDNNVIIYDNPNIELHRNNLMSNIGQLTDHIRSLYPVPITPVGEESFKRNLIRKIISGEEQLSIIMYISMERQNINYNTKYSIFLDYPKEENVYNTTILLIACRFGMHQLAYILASNLKVDVFQYELYENSIDDMCALDYAINKNMDKLTKLLEKRTKEYIYKLSGMLPAEEFKKSEIVDYDLNVKGMDFIDMQEMTVNEWLNLKPTNFAINMNNTYTLLDIDNLKSSMVYPSNIKYKCNQINSISPNNIDISKPYYLLRGFGFPSGVINGNELFRIIMHINGVDDQGLPFPKERVFILEEKKERLLSTVSFKVLHGGSLVGASHCQGGDKDQSEDVYMIKLPRNKN